MKHVELDVLTVIVKELVKHVNGDITYMKEFVFILVQMDGTEIVRTGFVSLVIKIVIIVLDLVNLTA